jgi:hypothetical protein
MWLWTLGLWGAAWFLPSRGRAQLLRLLRLHACLSQQACLLRTPLRATQPTLLRDPDSVKLSGFAKAVQRQVRSPLAPKPMKMKLTAPRDGTMVLPKRSEHLANKPVTDRVVEEEEQESKRGIDRIQEFRSATAAAARRKIRAELMLCLQNGWSPRLLLSIYSREQITRAQPNNMHAGNRTTWHIHLHAHAG